MIRKQYFQNEELTREKLVDENPEKVFNETIDWVNNENKRLKKMGVEAKSLWTYYFEYNEKKQKKILNAERRDFSTGNHPWEFDSFEIIIKYYSNTKTAYRVYENGFKKEDKIIQKPATEVVADTIKWLKEQNKKIRKESFLFFGRYWKYDTFCWGESFCKKGDKPTDLIAERSNTRIEIDPA